MEVNNREADVFYIDDENHTMIAMVMISKNEYESYGPDTKYAHHLYVNKEYRGKGLTKLLIDKVAEKYGNCPITIMCEAYGEIGFSDEQLFKLYSEMGFYPDNDMYPTDSRMMVRLP